MLELLVGEYSFLVQLDQRLLLLLLNLKVMFLKNLVLHAVHFAHQPLLFVGQVINSIAHLAKVLVDGAEVGAGVYHFALEPLAFVRVDTQARCSQLGGVLGLVTDVGTFQL